MRVGHWKCEFIIATRVLCGETVDQRGCACPLDQPAPAFRTGARYGFWLGQFGRSDRRTQIML